MNRRSLGCDPYLTEALWDVERVLGRGGEQRLCRFTSVVLRPDAIVGRRVEQAMAILQSEGFVPLGSIAVTFSRHIVREQWRADGLIAVPRVLRHLVDLYIEATQSLFVLLRHDAPPDGDATSLARSLKGPSVSNQREERHIRRRLGSDSNLIAFIHTPDSQQSFLRELGLFLDYRQRDTALGWIGGEAADWRLPMASLYAQYDAHDLNLPAALERIEQRISVALGASPMGAVLLRRISSALAGEDQDPGAMFDELAGRGVAISVWDRILFLDRALRQVSFGPKWPPRSRRRDRRA